MRSLIDTLLKYRLQILLFLIFTQVVFSATSYFDTVDDDDIMLNARNILTILIILFSFTFLDKINVYQFIAKRREIIQDHSPSQYIYYDSTNRTVTVSNTARASLSLPVKKHYNLNDISSLFPTSDWEEISKYIENPMSFLNIEKLGMIEINITNDDKNYYKYAVQTVRDRTYGVYGVLLWFVDFTSTRLAELELLTLLKRYREISFDTSVTLDELPVAVWKRNAAGEVILHNNMFNRIKKHADENLLIQLKKTAHTGFIKNILIKNVNHTYKFQEVNVDNSEEKIGYAIDVTDTNSMRKNIEYLKNTIETILELSSNATLVIDDKRKIIKFNTAFVHLFNLDRTWLSSNISYFTLLDKLKEQGKLFETADYKAFRNAQLEFLNNLKAPNHELQHLPDGRTLRVSTVPTELGNTIFVYDNVTDVLRIERSYNELMETLKVLLLEINEAVCVVDHIGKIRIHNHSFAKLITGNTEIASDAVFFDLIQGTKSEVLKANKIKILDELSIAHELRRSECVELVHDGEKVKMSVSPLPDNGALIIFNL